jgi:hypothetical protein
MNFDDDGPRFAGTGIAWVRKRVQDRPSSENRGFQMSYYSPELVRTMRSVLDEVVTRIPAHRATSAVKAKIAEVILNTAARGQRSYEGLISAASEQVPTIISGPSLVWKTKIPRVDKSTLRNA